MADERSYEDLYRSAREAGRRIPYRPEDPQEYEWLQMDEDLKPAAREWSQEGVGDYLSMPRGPSDVLYSVPLDPEGERLRVYYRDGSSQEIENKRNDNTFMIRVGGPITKAATLAMLGFTSGGIATPLLGAVGGAATGGALAGSLGGGVTERGLSGKGALLGGTIGGLAGAAGASAKGITAVGGEGAGLTELAPQTGIGGYGSASAAMVPGASGLMGSGASSMTRIGLNSLASNLMSPTQGQEWPRNVMPTESFNATQGVTQPSAEDLSAYSDFGRSQISSMGRRQRTQTKESAAARGMGTGSGSLYGDINVINMRNRKTMEEYARMLSDPNMGYNDINASLANILV